MKQFLCILSGIICSHFISAQICKPAVSVHFESGKDVLTKVDQQNLIQFIKSKKAQEYVIEVYAGTDDIGPEINNLKLSVRRAESVKKVIEKNFPGKINSIRAIGRGELNPAYPNTSEQNKYMNRRVDILLFPVVDGKIILKGEQGTELEVEDDFFGSCAICESKPQMTEYLTEEQASREGILLLDTADQAMETGGMMKFDFSCLDKQSKCKNAKVRIPAAKIDPEMTVWESVVINGQIRWVDTGKPVGIVDGYYELDIPCLNQNFGRLFNADKRRLGAGCIFGLQTPHELNKEFSIKDTNSSKYFVDENFYKENHAMISSLTPKCADPTVRINHVVTKSGIEYSYSGGIDKYLDPESKFRSYSIPNSAYTKKILESDTVVILKVPRNFAPGLHIPVIDSSYSITEKYKGKKRKYTYKYPTAHSKIVLFSTLNSTNPQIVDEKEYVLKEKRRYKKRKKTLKIKVKQVK